MKENNEKLETEVKNNEKKPYETPMFTRHEPLDSVSTVYYYYYVY
jgi:hypothetical protein